MITMSDTVTATKTDRAPVRPDQDPTTLVNLDVVRRAIAELTACGSKPPDALYAPDFRSLGPTRGPCDIRGATAASAELFGAFADARVDIERMVGEGERVITHIRFRGQHTAEFQGCPPTGGVMGARGVLVHRLRAGRITEAWTVLRWV